MMKTPGNDRVDGLLDAKQTTDSKAVEKPVLDLNDAGEVSDELDDQLFGQFADVISKVREVKDIPPACSALT